MRRGRGEKGEKARQDQEDFNGIESKKLSFSKAFELNMSYFLLVYQAFHFFDKCLALFNDFPDLIRIEFYKWSIISLLPVIKQPVVVLPPGDLNLVGPNIIPVER